MTGQYKGIVRPNITYSFWASPGQNQTLDELADKMIEIGNVVLQVDRDNNRLLLKKFTVEQDVWGCIFCRDQGSIVILDTEDELLAHCDADHEGWRDR